jgi:hypothetical protein
VPSTSAGSVGAGPVSSRLPPADPAASAALARQVRSRHRLRSLRGPALSLQKRHLRHGLGSGQQWMPYAHHE